ncbi:hypothetical protein UUU_38800 [Klebsiella pneumoniae subsp. pneumoniae DSM 30104 = JCM 1662 = NBRC 14940]|nr:hypothetical protein UUU_38800 [Klebsiella pneumoniae subsp. pneumoniae DSM 30104 = JCM 1662 = NBRC 14940]
MPFTTLLQNTSGRKETLITKNSAQKTMISTARDNSITTSACCHSARLRNS